MHENNIGCVVVAGMDADRERKPVGIITEKDVVRLLRRLDAASLLLAPCSR